MMLVYRQHTGHCAHASSAMSNQTDGPCTHIGKSVVDHRATMPIVCNVRNGSQLGFPAQLSARGLTVRCLRQPSATEISPPADGQAHTKNPSACGRWGVSKKSIG